MAHDHAHHDHSHAHDHSHGHAGHSHAPDNFGWAFAIGAALNTAFVIAELIFGYAANSLALISTPSTISPTWPRCCWHGARRGCRRRSLRSSTPMAIAVPRSWRRCSTLACCWSQSAALPSRRSTGSTVRLRSRAGRLSWSRRLASRSTAARRYCSCAVAMATSIFAAPICTWWRTPVFRSAWWWRR